MAIALLFLTIMIVTLSWPRIVAGLANSSGLVDEAGRENRPTRIPAAWTHALEAGSQAETDGAMS